MTNKLIQWRRRMATGCLLPGLAVVLTAIAQPIQDEGRKLWDTLHNKNIGQSQPGSQAAKPQPARPKHYYLKKTPQIPSEQVAADTVVGVTLWLLQPAPASAPTAARLLVQQGAQKVSYVPQRIEAETKLVEGQQVRLSIEAARTGYVYVINREEYRDGTFSEPYLIFPTDRTYRRDNQVAVGRVIEIPSQLDLPPYFTLRPSRPDQVGESVSVLVTAQPLKLPRPLEPDPITLPWSLFAEWERTCGRGIGRFELESGRGQAWTAAERAAGADGARKLTQDEPYPQSLYYRAGAKAGEPVLVTIPLRYANASGSK
jgi:hypothetical protein